MFGESPTRRIESISLSQVFLSTTTHPIPSHTTHRQHNVHRSAQLLANRFHARHNAVAYLLGRVHRHVVCSDHQHNTARPHIVQLAVLQTPQRVLRAIRRNAKVEAVQRRKQRVPHVAGGVLQRLQDAVADEDDVRVFFAALGQKAFVLDAD